MKLLQHEGNFGYREPVSRLLKVEVSCQLHKAVDRVLRPGLRLKEGTHDVGQVGLAPLPRKEHAEHLGQQHLGSPYHAPPPQVGADRQVYLAVLPVGEPDEGLVVLEAVVEGGEGYSVGGEAGGRAVVVEGQAEGLEFIGKVGAG